MTILNTSDYATVRELCDALLQSPKPVALVVGEQIVIVKHLEK